MRVLSLLEAGAIVMAPDAHDYYVGTSRFATAASQVLFTNVSRPGKIPIAGDTIALRDIVTNRRIAVVRDRSTPTAALRLWRSPLLTEYNAERYNALITVLEVTPRTDGMSKWTLAPKSPLSGERLDVVVWDRSVVAQVLTAAGAPVVLDVSGLQIGRGAGALIGFHSLDFNDVLDLHWDERVWLSVDGRPVELDDDNNLTTGLLPAPSSGRQSWNGRPFLIETVDRSGFLTQDTRFRLRSLESNPFPGATNIRVVVRDGRLRLQPDVRDDDAAAFFRYSELVNLDLYWNPTVQDNAIVTGPAPTGYSRVRTEGRAFLGAKNGTVPIKRFYSATRNDTMTTATVAGEEAALTSSAGYVYQGIAGWAFEAPRPGTRVARQYWHAGRGDNMFTATAAGENSAGGYAFVYDDCHVLLGPLTAVTAFDPGHLGPAPTVRPRLPDDARPDLGGVRDPRPIPLPSVPRRPVRALVLSGGGARGCFEAGAILGLWRSGYRPDIVCGVSVGAINAAKIAEGGDETAEQLVRLWRQLAATPEAVFLKELHLSLLSRALDDVTGAAEDIGIGALIGKIVGMLVAPGAPFIDDQLAIASFLIAGETSGLSEAMRRLLNLVAMTHGIHCMEPLRRQLARTDGTGLQPGALADSRIRLRLGVSDAKNGNYFSVTEPFSIRADADFEDMKHFGLIEPEFDMAAGGNWLTQPIFDCKHYAMRIADAVYASSTMPVFMEPYRTNLGVTQLVTNHLGRIGLLDLRLPRGVAELIAAVAPEGVLPRRRERIDMEAVRRTVDELGELHGLPADQTQRDARLRKTARTAVDGQRGPSSRERTFFDGGLVDAIPIRTAIRMGATEIMVIGVDQLNTHQSGLAFTPPLARYSWLRNLFGGDILGGLSPEQLPFAQYGMGALRGFIQGTTRGDLQSALGVVDARRVGHLAGSQMTEEQRRTFEAALITEAQENAGRRRALLGGTTALGGLEGDSYGDFTTRDIAIDVILPDRPLLDALGFEDINGVNEGIELGLVAARNPVKV